MKMSQLFWAAGLAATMLVGCVKQPTKITDTPIKESIKQPTVNWRQFNKLSLTESRINRKIMFFYFTSTGFKNMDETTFQDKKVIKLLNENFIPILMDGKHYSIVMEKFGLELVWPTVAFVAPNGIMLGSVNGYVSPEALGGALEEIVAVQKKIEEGNTH